MNEYGHLAITGLATVVGVVARYAVAGVEHRIAALEKQSEEDQQTIIGCQLKIAALEERTKRI